MSTNFNMMQHHKYSLTELENMMPWEREIYVKLLIQYLKDEEMRIRQKMQKTDKDYKWLTRQKK